EAHAEPLAMDVGPRNHRGLALGLIIELGAGIGVRDDLAARFRLVCRAVLATADGRKDCERRNRLDKAGYMHDAQPPVQASNRYLQTHSHCGLSSGPVVNVVVPQKAPQ